VERASSSQLNTCRFERWIPHRLAGVISEAEHEELLDLTDRGSSALDGRVI
jgi:hypothetical protein